VAETSTSLLSVFFFNMEEGDQKELQLLPSQLSIASSSSSSSLLDSSLRYKSSVVSDHHHHHNQFGGPSLDLQLSISVRPIQAQSNCVLTGPICDFSDAKTDTSCVETLKWQAAEQIKLAAIEKAYAERVRELTRREMELAQSEFAKARHMWQRAREEVEKAESMKEKATRKIDSTCMEITCQSCRQRLKP
jgi:RNase P subunit RPR2